MNSARLRQRLSIVYAAATLAGSRVFHASSAIRAFRVALSAVKGGSGGRSILRLLLSLFVNEYLNAFDPERPEYGRSFSLGLTEGARGIHPFICSLALLWRASISNFLCAVYRLPPMSPVGRKLVASLHHPGGNLTGAAA